MTKMTRHIFTTELRVSDGDRVLMFNHGLFQDVLGPGQHKFPNFAASGFGVKRNAYEQVIISLSELCFTSELTDTLLRDHAEAMADFLTVVETNENQVALISRDGRLFSVLRPSARELLLKEAADWTVEIVTIPTDFRVTETTAKRLAMINTMLVKRIKVEHGHAGMLFIDGAFVEALKPAAHVFWNVGQTLVVQMIDLREHALDVTGQEVLTKDRVSIRVNLSATYKVVDAGKAITAVKSFEDTLYRALGHAFRKTLSTKTLDEVLAQKGRVDDEAAAEVRATVERAGLEVSAITLKDVILPGEMRDILNRVVEAEKEAEAGDIRRREETADTRVLLNTAKVMADNPAMLRLKELETLEAVADKVGNLTVHNGTKGLLDDLVSRGAKT